MRSACLDVGLGLCVRSVANAAACALLSLHTCFTTTHTLCIRSPLPRSSVCLACAFCCCICSTLIHSNTIRFTHHSLPLLPLIVSPHFPFCAALHCTAQSSSLVFGCGSSLSAQSTLCLGCFASSVLSLRPASQTHLSASRALLLYSSPCKR